jgi:hypothetical protein
MNKRKVFHVEMKEPVDGKRHFYFGSKKAIFERFSHDAVGITYRTLTNCVKLSNGPYENKKCVIRQGELITTAKK